MRRTPIELDRRQILDRAWKTAGGALALSLIPAEHVLAAQPNLGANPFTLGVAAGDPRPESIVLWTRLAPEPLYGGGMPGRPVQVPWRVARDPEMRQVVAEGVATAMPELAHSVHVEVEGLLPGADYFYQFSYRSDESTVGHFRTPVPEFRPLRSMDFAIATCQAWTDGYFTVLRDIARQDVDVVFHLGDYTYEYDPRQNVRGIALPHRFAGETVTLTRYRDQHALYKTDADLQAAHAAHAFVVIWDDHEVQNDYSGKFPEYMNMPVEEFIARRANAYQAYYEHMPIRKLPRGPLNKLNIHRRLRFGDLAEFTMLDTRQYRTDNPCGDGEQQRCAASFDPASTMLGTGQEKWAIDGFAASRARWNFIVQGVLVAELDHDGDAGELFWQDAWDGYPGARERMLQAVQQTRLANPVVLTGDWHSTFVNDLKLDFKNEGSPVMGTEFVTPAVTSGGDGTPYGPYYAPMIPFNPHIKYFEGDKRGWFLFKLNQFGLQADLRFASKVEIPDGKVRLAERFHVESGKPGAVRLSV